MSRGGGGGLHGNAAAVEVLGRVWVEDDDGVEGGEADGVGVPGGDGGGEGLLVGGGEGGGRVVDVPDRHCGCGGGKVGGGDVDWWVVLVLNEGTWRFCWMSLGGFGLC